MSAFTQAAREFAREVDQEASQLVARGVPPWDAVMRARQRVSERRREQSAVPAPARIPAPRDEPVINSDGSAPPEALTPAPSSEGSA